jgi:hypothetical protein
MKHLAVASVIVILLVESGLASAVEGSAPASVEFVGTSPCGALPREFLGGIAPATACDAITWRLALLTAVDGTRTWTLSALYQIPAPARPGHMVAGPRVALEGTWEAATTTLSNALANTYRLRAHDPERSLWLAGVGDGLLHILAEDKSLLVGTSGWSYTLNQADRAEKAGIPAPAPELSYTVSPRATGPGSGVFEGRTPCRGIADALKLPEIPGCIKVKWRVTLHQDPQSAAPTTYKVEGTLHRSAAREGTWAIVRGQAGSDSPIYRLAATQTEAPLLLMKGDDNVLYFLNQQQRPLIGNADFSYTLNRVTKR